MTSADYDVKSLHFEGGNFFDDMRIDIAESHRRLDRSTWTKNTKRSKYQSIVAFYLTRITLWLGINEFFVVNGVRKRWLYDFKNYWSEILNGRPLWNTLDFFMLLHDYRKRQQQKIQLEWNDPKQHLANWQHPDQLYATFHNVRACALHPIKSMELWKKVSKGMRILEYGCSLAPYFYCYREFFSHLNCQWILADIPSYPFHYAKYLYRNDSDVEFVTIYDSDFSNPLRDESNFDVVILTEVFEHLDDPLFISDYLLKRLRVGGLFVFDYINSEGKGLDHPKAQEMRQDCLKSILAQTQIMYGEVNDIAKSVGLCIVRKKINLS
jgi:2-polyprenyl-3-methyl-5-hydroxy-6-metoxy-1,4-benzoquinol methylase